MLLYIHRDHKDYKGRGAQDGHLDFHAALNSESLSFTPTETIRTIRSGEPWKAASTFKQFPSSDTYIFYLLFISVFIIPFVGALSSLYYVDTQECFFHTVSQSCLIKVDVRNLS